MSKITGIICEFNPFHAGHKYLIERSKGIAETTVCIMSGNFVQRGECSVTEKYKRAKSALDAGADLVVELPFPWCAAPAEFFARAGVSLAARLGVTDLVFGSECGNTDTVMRAAKLSSSEDFCKLTEDVYRDNVGYAEARYKAALALDNSVAEVFNSSNDMLAVEYIKQSKALGSTFDFHATMRISTPPATQIRESMIKDHAEGRGALDALPEKLFDAEMALFRLKKASGDSFDSESGILARLEKSALAASSGEEMLSLAATKKYTNSRLRRAALFSVCGIKKEHLLSLPEYTLLLAADPAGREVLNGAKDIEVVTKPADASSPQFALEANSERLYSLCRANGAPGDEFLKNSPYVY
ncbi:MAG: nucleotidyltransferase family protein [Clostridia bacterium]|nr:nucleotidyltransferase family protein [Clostridia bacterium]